MSGAGSEVFNGYYKSFSRDPDDLTRIADHGEPWDGDGKSEGITAAPKLIAIESCPDPFGLPSHTMFAQPDASAEWEEYKCAALKAPMTVILAAWAFCIVTLTTTFTALFDLLKVLCLALLGLLGVVVILLQFVIIVVWLNLKAALAIFATAFVAYVAGLYGWWLRPFYNMAYSLSLDDEECCWQFFVKGAFQCFFYLLIALRAILTQEEEIFDLNTEWFASVGRSLGAFVGDPLEYLSEYPFYDRSPLALVGEGFEALELQSVP